MAAPCFFLKAGSHSSDACETRCQSSPHVAATAQRLMSDYMSRLGQPSGTDDERDEAKARARAITGRFSVYAPDANELDANEFRAALKENMMRDREKRRSGALKGGQLASDYMSRLSSGGSQ